jgi:Transcriptional regulator, AbiEi antitoxin
MLTEPHVVPSLMETLARQEQVVSRAQLLAAGVHDVTISRRIRRGIWRRLVPGVYCLAMTGLTTDQRRIAASLYGGENAQITGLAALHWYGFRSPASERVALLVPHMTHKRSSGYVTILRTESLDPAFRDEGRYHLVSPARAVIDAGRMSTDLRTVRAVMAEAVHSQSVSLDALARELRRANRSRTALVRYVMAEILGGVRSSPEADLRAILRSSRVLPKILWNPTLTASEGTQLPTPHGYIPEVHIAIEVDSREHHADGEHWKRTLDRQNIYSLYGISALHFTPTEIRLEPTRIRRAVERAYLRARKPAGGVSGDAVLYKECS